MKVRNCRKMFSRWAAVVAGLMAVGLAGTALGQAPNVEPGKPVSFYLSVEEDEKLVTGLKHDNFRLWESGEARQFQVAPATEPWTMLVVVELSQSSYLYYREIQRAVQDLTAMAPRGGHKYALATFSNNYELIKDFTEKPIELQFAFEDKGIPIMRQISTYDAVLQGLEKLQALPGRRVLVVIGSGVDTISGHTMDAVRKKAEATNVNIFAMGFGRGLSLRLDRYLSSPARLTLLQAQAFMQMLADKTGGYAWFPNFEAGIRGDLEALFTILSHQYRMTYVPTAGREGKFQEITVEAFRLVDDERKNYEEHVRDGWRFPKEQQAR